MLLPPVIGIMIALQFHGYLHSRVLGKVAYSIALVGDFGADGGSQPSSWRFSSAGR